MKLKNVTVKNFKSLRDFSVSGFQDINLIYGLNNSGKSNFLKFLNILFSRKEIRRYEEYIDDNGEKKIRTKVDDSLPFYDGNIYEPYIFWKDERSIPIEFKIGLETLNTDFPEYEKIKGKGVLNEKKEKSTLNISGVIKSIDKIKSQIIITEVNISNTIIFKNPTELQNAGIYFDNEKIDKSLKGDQELFDTILDSLSDLFSLIDCDRHFSKETISHDIDILNSKKFKSWIYEQYINSDKYDNFQNLVKFINGFAIGSNIIKNSKGLEENISSFPLNDTKIGFTKFSDEFEIMFEINNNRYPLRNFGTGIQQIFYILCRIFETKSKIVLIEELELNLSPTYQELLINNLKSIVSDHAIINQIMFTSHSDYLLRSDYAVYQADIDKEGETKMHKPKISEEQQYRRQLLKTFISKD